MLTEPRGSVSYRWFWRWLFFSIVTIFPVAVLQLVQINALRYQSDLIVWVQRIWLSLDLAALVWLFPRNTLDGSVWPERRPAKIRRWVGLLWAPVLIAAVNLVYLDTVPGDADPRLVRYDQPEPSWLHYMAGNPLDIMLCPHLHWGCRFLRVDHRTLVGKVWDEKAMSILRMDRSKLVTVLAQEMPGIDPDQAVSLTYAKAMAAIEGVFLRGRSLRFAVLDASRLCAADLIEARLQNASLVEADLRAAKLVSANLQGANLSDTNLNDANLYGAYMFAANLTGAQLIGADLTGAYLTNANLLAADLTRAKMFTAVVSSQQLNEACGVEAVLPKWAMPGLPTRAQPGFSLKPCSKPCRSPFEKSQFSPLEMSLGAQVEMTPGQLSVRFEAAAFPSRPDNSSDAERSGGDGRSGAARSHAQRLLRREHGEDSEHQTFPGASTVARSPQAGGTGGECGLSGFNLAATRSAATAAATSRESRPFVGWPGASRLFGGRCRAG